MIVAVSFFSSHTAVLLALEKVCRAHVQQTMVIDTFLARLVLSFYVTRSPYYTARNKVR
jgi:hypothetical protein